MFRPALDIDHTDRSGGGEREVAEGFRFSEAFVKHTTNYYRAHRLNVIYEVAAIFFH